MTQRECSHSRRWTDQESPFVKCFPLKTFGLLSPLGFGVVGVFQWWGRGGLASKCSSSFLPSGLGGDLLGGIPGGAISLDPPQRVSFPPPFSPSRELPGGVQRKRLASGACRHLLVTSWGTVLWFPRLARSRSRQPIKSFGNKSLLLFIFSKWERWWWASPGR